MNNPKRPHAVVLSTLPEELQQQVMKFVSGDDDRLWEEKVLLTYRQAAKLYGFTEQTIRVYVHYGWIKTVRAKGARYNWDRRITHRAMRAYEKQHGSNRGRPRKSEMATAK